MTSICSFHGKSYSFKHLLDLFALILKFEDWQRYFSCFFRVRRLAAFLAIFAPYFDMSILSPNSYSIPIQRRYELLKSLGNVRPLLLAGPTVRRRRGPLLFPENSVVSAMASVGGDQRGSAHSTSRAMAMAFRILIFRFRIRRSWCLVLVDHSDGS